MDGGKTVLARDYGESSPRTPARADTPYYLGSTSKMFTALAVLRLVREGLVDLDRPYRTDIPEFTLALPGAADRITVRQLLNQTGGLKDRGLGSASLGESSLAGEVERARTLVPSSLPGERFSYNNLNDRLLALLIERVRGTDFGALGMADSRAGKDAGQDSLGLPLAAGHGTVFGLPFFRPQTYRPGALGSGYMVSTAQDVSRYFEAALAAWDQGDPSLAAAWTMPAQPAEPGPLAALMGGLVLAAVLYEAFRFFRLRAWLRRPRSGSRGWALVRAAIKLGRR